jgi:hypothetical protein
VTMWYGPNKTRRMLRCSTCKARFSERKGTPRFDSRLPQERVVAILAHVSEGIGTRQTARLTGAHQDTVTRYIRQAGEHAQQLHDELVAFSPTTTAVQFDEKWSFVGKKEKNRDPEDDKAGDCWDHTAIDPESRLIVSLVVGKRTAEATHELIRDFHTRTGWSGDAVDDLR